MLKINSQRKLGKNRHRLSVFLFFNMTVRNIIDVFTNLHSKCDCLAITNAASRRSRTTSTYTPFRFDVACFIDADCIAIRCVLADGAQHQVFLLRTVAGDLGRIE